jgi:hypothetical protein
MNMRFVSTNRPRRRALGGMALITLIGILAVITIFAVVLLRALLREIDFDVAREERASLRTFGDAFTKGVMRQGYIPSQNEWAGLVANQAGMDLATVAHNRRNQPRILLIDANGWLNTVSLPWTQPQAGSTNVPSNARMMVVSGLGKALPIASGMATPAVFNPLWNGTNNFTTGAWAGWGGQPGDVQIERINLTPLFVALYIVTAGDYPAAGQYTIGTNTTLLAAPSQHLNVPYNPRYLIAGTSLNLYHASPSNTLDAIQILNKDGSYIYDRGIWKSSAAGGVLPGGVDIATVVNAFLNAPYNQHAQNTTPYPEIQQYMVVGSMMNYMSNYIAWASGSTAGGVPFSDNGLYLNLRNNIQPNMMSTIQGLFMGVSSYYPVNTTPCK